MSAVALSKAQHAPPLCRSKRAKLERAIEAAIAYLDQLDGEPDLELDDPPEDNCDRELDRSDDEPSLGWPIPTD